MFSLSLQAENWLLIILCILFVDWFYWFLGHGAKPARKWDAEEERKVCFPGDCMILFITRIRIIIHYNNYDNYDN